MILVSFTEKQERFQQSDYPSSEYAKAKKPDAAGAWVLHLDRDADDLTDAVAIEERVLVLD
ncbi:hypothetical protein [Mesorhizobium sp. J8]|uniref:hypothetical protein n=1 Tax=Mesorhizobium sp. J8 TaxID=2777475 RepID=UPI001915222D|nr:hypothetical protein [Mesorhizobium sp. J8]